MLSLVLLCCPWRQATTALCFSLQTLLLNVDKTSGVVVVNNLGDVGVEGCVGGVGTANGAQRSELCCWWWCQRGKEKVRKSIFPDLCRKVYTNNATTPSGPGPPLPAPAPSLNAYIAAAMPSAEPVASAIKIQWNQQVSRVPLKCTRSQKKWGQIKVIHRLSTGYPQTRMTVYDTTLTI
jgi:hypothetical protein